MATSPNYKIKPTTSIYQVNSGGYATPVNKANGYANPYSTKTYTAQYLGGGGKEAQSFTGSSIADIENKARIAGINPANLYGEGFAQGIYNPAPITQTSAPALSSSNNVPDNNVPEFNNTQEPQTQEKSKQSYQDLALANISNATNTPPMTFTLPDTGTPPPQQNLAELGQQKMEEFGINNIKSSLNGVNQQITELNNIYQNAIKAEKDKPILGTTIMGRVSKAAEQAQTALQPLLEQQQLLTNQLNDANQNLSNIMNWTSQDYQRSQQAYEFNVNKQLQLSSMINDYNYKQMTFEQQQQEKKKADVSAMINIFKETGTNWDSISDYQRVSLETQALQAGYPLGFIESVMSNIQPNEKVLATTDYVDENNQRITSVITKLPNGQTKTTNYVLGPSAGKNQLTAAQIQASVNQIAGSFDNEQIVKDYNTAQQGYQAIKSIGVNTKSPADDIAFIYAFAKIMDPNSVVREGEYNTIQKYAQTWADTFGFTAKRIFSNTNFLGADAKQKMLNALEPRVKSVTSQYEQVRNEYQRQIDDAYAGKPRTITEYSTTKDETNKLKDAWTKAGYTEPFDDMVNQFGIEAIKKKLGFNNDLSMSQNYSVMNKVAKATTGSNGGQCGRFVNKITNLGLGDTYQSKLAKMDKTIKEPKPGMVFVMPYKDTGHTGFILSINNGIATVKDSNYNLDQKVLIHQIPVSKMTGFTYA